jgi:DNA repair photolyase
MFVRWQGLTVEEDEGRRLPRLGADSVIRTFDAPEALGIRFHEIRARSALNRVPKQSRMPFRWTVNPYRGCSHACSYCSSGETRIFMADGLTKELADVRVGDEVYGTVRCGKYRRYEITPVLDHWSTVKPAHRVALDDGTELVVSGDHRFLSDAGWRHVAGSRNGVESRPHLSIDHKLLGIGSVHGSSDLRRRIVETADRLRVASVEPLGTELPLFDITTGTGDFLANGVVSHNCFARPTHAYLDLNAREDFEREIVVKVNVPELLKAELGRPSWKHEHVALGTNTDPYQWVEGRYKLMPGVWQALSDSGTPGSLVTKSPLVLRDLPLLQELHERAEMSVYMSVPTLDEGAWRETEPHTPSPRARIEAVAKLNAAGVPAGILVAPLMPGINDSPEQVAKILELAEEAGAISVAAVTLHLRGDVKDIMFDWLREHRPDLIPVYEQLYARGAYAPTVKRREHSELVKKYRSRRPRRRGRMRSNADGEAASPEAETEQESLF